MLYIYLFVLHGEAHIHSIEWWTLKLTQCRPGKEMVAETRMKSGTSHALIHLHCGHKYIDLTRDVPSDVSDFSAQIKKRRSGVSSR